MSKQSKLAYFVMQELMYSDEALEPDKLCVRVCLRDERDLTANDEEVTAAIEQLLVAGFLQQVDGSKAVELTEDGEDHFEWYPSPLNPQSSTLPDSGTTLTTDASFFTKLTTLACIVISFLCALAAIGLTIYTTLSHVDIGQSVLILAAGALVSLVFGEYIADA